MKRFKQAVLPQIRTNLFILFAAIALGVWQLDFVVTAVAANVYLNLTIFAGAAFGVVLHFYNLFNLRAEFVTLDALREAFDDASREAAVGADRPAEMARRRARMRGPALVFAQPRLMAQPASLLFAQVRRFGDTRIPNGSAAALVADLQQRVVEKISFSNYVAGLMVLLGLLGTFVGLLGTVGSVGDIIASLDMSGGAGSAAIQQLMSKLEAPLTGMATGFSSSLFGLIGSLILGVMTKVSARADKTLRRDFEAWLGRVAQFERLNDEPRMELDAAGEEADTNGPAAAVRAMLRIARASVVSNAQVTRRLDQLIDGYKALERESERARETESALAERLERSIGVQIDLLRIVRSSYESQGEPITRMSAAIERMEERLIREHGRARELQAQQNRAIVLQADQAAQRSALATSHLGQQTRALRETIEALGRSFADTLAEARSQGGGAAQGAAPRAPAGAWSAEAWSEAAWDDEAQDLGAGWGDAPSAPGAAAARDEIAKQIRERREAERRRGERRLQNRQVEQERRRSERRDEPRRGTDKLGQVGEGADLFEVAPSIDDASDFDEADTFGDDDRFDGDAGDVGAARGAGDAGYETEVEKWMIEISAAEFDDADEQDGDTGGRRSIA